MAQHRPHVGQYLKHSDDVWMHREFNDLAGMLHVQSLDCSVALAELYQDVALAPLTNPDLLT